MQIDFQKLIEQSPNAYVVVDRDLRIVWMNDAYLRTTMSERQDLLGRAMFDAFPSEPGSESHRLLDHSFRRVLATDEIDEIALIRYDIRSPEGAMEERFWSATHTPLLNEAGKTTHILQHTVDVTELQGLRALRDEMGIVERAQAVQARNLDLSEESEQLKLLFDQAPGFVAVLGGPTFEFRLANQAYLQLVGQRDVIGKPLAEALPEIVGQGFVDLLGQVRASGVPYVGKAEKVSLENAHGQPEERYLDFIYQPIFADDGSVAGVFVQGHDVSEQVEAREHQDLLINELNHRVKNTLAVVQGLATQSFREIDGSDTAKRVFDARLNALAAAHNLLTAQSWKSARLIDTVRGSIEATAGSDIDRFDVCGPDIELSPQTAMSAAMLVHELTTNAIKHGALSAPAGRVAIDWTLAEDAGHRTLSLSWSENGGPVVLQPPRRGFGTRLIRRGIASGLGSSEVELAFDPAGLRCTIVVRLPSASQ